jgi:metal-responsive CopG/Arc/MetJ family transcriptional regulator
MSAARICVTLEHELLARLDRAVQERRLPTRSQAVQEALREKLNRLAHDRLARECAKLDPCAEQQLAEEALAEDTKRWPEY